jgi:hypothetical protein
MMEQVVNEDSPQQQMKRDDTDEDKDIEDVELVQIRPIGFPSTKHSSQKSSNSEHRKKRKIQPDEQSSSFSSTSSTSAFTTSISDVFTSASKSARSSSSSSSSFTSPSASSNTSPPASSSITTLSASSSSSSTTSFADSISKKLCTSYIRELQIHCDKMKELNHLREQLKSAEEATSTSSSNASKSTTPLALTLMQNAATSPISSSTSSSSSTTTANPSPTGSITQCTAYRINIFTKPYAFELMGGSSFFSSGKDAKIDYSKELKETEAPTDGEIYVNSDINKQLEGLDEHGCLAIPFLPCSKREQRVGFMTGLELKSDCTSITYGIKMRPSWGVVAKEYVPELPKDDEFTTNDRANFKKLLVTKNIFGWLKDADSGELCIHCSREEAVAFIEEIKRRLAKLTPRNQGGNVDAELVVQPPLEENIPPYIWVKLPGLILRQVGLIIYIYASRHVFVVDNKESLLLLGKMPFTKNLQPPTQIAATTAQRGVKRKRK